MFPWFHFLLTLSRATVKITLRLTYSMQYTGCKAFKVITFFHQIDITARDKGLSSTEQEKKYRILIPVLIPLTPFLPFYFSSSISLSVINCDSAFD